MAVGDTPSTMPVRFTWPVLASMRKMTHCASENGSFMSCSSIPGVTRSAELLGGGSPLPAGTPPRRGSQSALVKPHLLQGPRITERRNVQKPSTRPSGGQQRRQAARAPSTACPQDREDMSEIWGARPRSSG